MFSFIDKYYTKKFSKFYLRYSLFINFQTYSINGFASFLSKRIQCVLEIFNIRRVYSVLTSVLCSSVQSMCLNLYVT